ncbi:interferon omega-1-like, partial [Physeter macrocephalus]|uniref:Interferon omega-1-like n=1 Tax=Physeter macrocephalus TaxID=9755 RepID=A0A455BGZ2_PHYMC
MALLRKDVIREPTCNVPPDARLSQASSSLICPMAFVLSLLTALVMFSYGPGRSLGCDLSQNHVLVSRKNFMVLSQMRRISPRFCLKDTKDFGSPQDMVDGSQLPKAQATSVLHEMLQQIFCLFHTERSSATWDTSLLDKLRTGLHQQLEDLDACLVQAMREEESALGMVGPTLAVRRYFQGIHLYLEEKKYSDCAWKIVSLGIMRSFSSSTKLQERLRIKDGGTSL